MHLVRRPGRHLLSTSGVFQACRRPPDAGRGGGICGGISREHVAIALSSAAPKARRATEMQARDRGRSRPDLPVEELLVLGLAEAGRAAFPQKQVPHRSRPSSHTILRASRDGARQHGSQARRRAMRCSRIRARPCCGQCCPSRAWIGSQTGLRRRRAPPSLGAASRGAETLPLAVPVRRVRRPLAHSL
jgi:hypothetical protein